MNKFLYRLGMTIFLLFGLFTQVFAQRPNASAVTQLLSAGSQPVTVDSLLLNETFDDANAWETYSDKAVNAKVVKGVYRMSLKGYFYTWGLNNSTHTDVVIQAEMLQNSLDENNSFGVMCRADTDGNGYYFQLSGDGYYSIIKHDGTDVSQIVEWVESKVIHQGQTRNQMTAVCVGDYLALYANGELLGETTDSTFTEGFAGFTVGTFADDQSVDVSFDNAAIWSATGGGIANASGLPETLKNFAGKSESAVAELAQLGVIPSGSLFIFGEDYAFFTGRGSFFTPLASDSPRKNIVMAGELTFTVGNPDEFEACILTSRINRDARGTATTFVDVGLSNNGEVYINDVFSESADSTFAVGAQTVDLTEPHHILFILQETKAAVYLDGELVISDFEVDARAGTYGISLIGKGVKAKCEGRNLWAYQIPSANTGGCTVTANRNVNRRTGPGTTFDSAGQLASGQDASVIGQSKGNDGLIWWELGDNSWVREDVVTEIGNCSSVPAAPA